MAQKSRGILRSTAKNLLESLARRAREANARPEFVYSVARIAVFGSYVSSDKEKLGDLDVAIELVPRYQGDDLAKAREEAFIQRGPQTSNFVDRYMFAYNEVARYLRNRSACMSLHTYEELVKLNADHLVIYDRASENQSKRDRSVAGCQPVLLDITKQNT